MKSLQVGFLGAGNMGRAIIAALLRSGCPAENISVGEPQAAARESLSRDFGIAANADNQAAIRTADVVVVAVKPQDMASVLAPLTQALAARKPVVLSIAAGIRINDLQNWCGVDSRIVRAMPNRPALVGAGATGLFAANNVSAAQRELAERVMQSCGAVVWLPREELIDVVTALSGSGPAYFFLLAEAMTDAAVQLGLDAAAARSLAIATLHGAGSMAIQPEADLPTLRQQVTSKGGTTEAALRVFDEAGLRAIVARALAAATQRGAELAQQFGPTR